MAVIEADRGISTTESSLHEKAAAVAAAAVGLAGVGAAALTDAVQSSRFLLPTEAVCLAHPVVEALVCSMPAYDGFRVISLGVALAALSGYQWIAGQVGEGSARERTSRMYAAAVQGLLGVVAAVSAVRLGTNLGVVPTEPLMNDVFLSVASPVAHLGAEIVAGRALIGSLMINLRAED
jgi:hypothetical protein